MDLDNKQRYKERYTSKSTRYIKVYHQNIRGSGMKSGEILGHLYPDYPQVLCLTEHNLRKPQIKHKTKKIIIYELTIVEKIMKKEWLYTYI